MRVRLGTWCPSLLWVLCASFEQNFQVDHFKASPQFGGIPLKMLDYEGTSIMNPSTKMNPCKTFVGRGENGTGPRSNRKGRIRCGIEWDEWVLVEALVSPSHTVLELGARFGTTSCALARATGNSGRVVAVEPDASVWKSFSLES